MQETDDTPSVALDLAGGEGRIERLIPKGSGEAALRFSGRPAGVSQPGPLTLTEAELIQLLHEASHAGVLSSTFFDDLRADVEI